MPRYNAVIEEGGEAASKVPPCYSSVPSATLRSYGLIKKYRVDVIRAPALDRPEVKEDKAAGVSHKPAVSVYVGVYVDAERGGFYARVPETPEGLRIEAPSKGELRAKVLAALAAQTEIEWTPMIALETGDGYWSPHGSAHLERKLPPTVRLRVTRYYQGQLGPHTVYRDWNQTEGHHKRLPWPETRYSTRAALPFTQGLWERLLLIEDRLRTVHLELRALVDSSTEDPEAFAAAVMAHPLAPNAFTAHFSGYAEVEVLPARTPPPPPRK